MLTLDTAGFGVGVTMLPPEISSSREMHSAVVLREVRLDRVKGGRAIGHYDLGSLLCSNVAFSIA